MKIPENKLDKILRLAREDEAEKIAKKLLQTNQNTNYIQKITELSKEEINELKK